MENKFSPKALYMRSSKFALIILLVAGLLGIYYLQNKPEQKRYIVLDSKTLGSITVAMIDYRSIDLIVKGDLGINVSTLEKGDPYFFSTIVQPIGELSGCYTPEAMVVLLNDDNYGEVVVDTERCLNFNN